MQRLFTCVLVLAATLASTQSAKAHFLFIRIGDHAEAGRTSEVFFSEIARAGDPLFVPRIAHTRLWMQVEPGKFKPLKVREGTDRLRAFLPASGAVSVTGECTFGVVKRDVPFLLRYYPKAVSGPAEQINKLTSNKEQRFEIVPTFNGDSVTFTAMKDGKVVPSVKFTTVDDDLANEEEVTADKSGKATWKPGGPSHYCVYAKLVEDKSGIKDGKEYTEIRNFATLAFSWPLHRTDADKEAVDLFEQAIASRATWKNFTGFQGEAEGVYDGRSFSGKFKVDDEGSASADLDEGTAVDWFEDQLGSIALHRKASDEPREKPVLHFADSNRDHPFGPLLRFVGGHFASSYRVKDGQITVVNRNFGSKNMTITILDNVKNADGKFLPESYTVQYWNAETGELLQTQSFQHSWKRVGSIDLPTQVTVTTATSAGLEVRSFRLKNLKLIPGK
ncbi:MAG: hypothetical protein CMJ78_10120 [Planctomycetaceae bacterium]|nr:hypothetical protein [Planctomycetaceae bacterium]